MVYRLFEIDAARCEREVKSRGRECHLTAIILDHHREETERLTEGEEGRQKWPGRQLMHFAKGSTHFRYREASAGKADSQRSATPRNLQQHRHMPVVGDFEVNMAFRWIVDLRWYISHRPLPHATVLDTCGRRW
jgi:hypothetical protein